MGRIGNISSDLRGTSRRSGVRVACVSKKDTANKPKGHRTGKSAAQKPAQKKRGVEAPLVIERFDSVWDALGFAPQEAAHLEARANLMIQMERIIKQRRWTQAEAARRCGVSQPRMNDLLRGKIDKFSIDALINMATALGRRVNFELLAA